MTLAALSLPFVLGQSEIDKHFKIGEPPAVDSYVAAQDYEVGLREGSLTVTSKNEDWLVGPKSSNNFREDQFIQIYDSGVFFSVVPEVGTEYKNGWLHSADFGEWGGTLTYFEKGSNKPIQILKKNIKAFGAEGDRLVILTGLSHLGIAETEIYSATKSDGKWEVKEIAKPPVVPGIAFWNGNSFLVGGAGPAATSVSLLPASDLINGIYKLGLDGKMAKITSFPFHKYRINSMVEEPNGTIWLGGLRMVARLEPNQDRTRYACSIFVRKNYGRPN